MGKNFDFKDVNNNTIALIKKYSQSNVISQLEKECLTQKALEVATSSVDDNSCFKRTPLAEDSLKEMADHIKAKGLQNPLIVREKDNGKYELILGRKRLYACKKNGISKIKVVVKKIDDEEFLCMQVANYRADKNSKEPNIVEMAYACRALQTGFGYTQSMIGYLAKESRSQITNTLRVLKLPREVLDQVSVGIISYGSAKAIASLPKEAIIEIVALIIKKDLNVREVEALARKYKKLIAKGKFEAKEKALPTSTKVKVVPEEKVEKVKYDTSAAKEEKRQSIVKKIIKPIVVKTKLIKAKKEAKKAAKPKPKKEIRPVIISGTENELSKALGCEVIVRGKTVLLVFKDEKEVSKLKDRIK